MSINLKEFELADIASAQECNKILGELRPVTEPRKGKPYYILFYFLAFTVSLLLFMIISGEMRLDKVQLAPLMIIPLAFIIILLIATSYEYKIFAQNNIELLIHKISPLFKKNESFLSMVVGKAASFKTPNWLSPELSSYCYFIFTTDRLLIMTFSHKIIGTDQLNQHLQNDTIEEVIDSIYTSPLIGNGKIKTGGIITQIIFNLTHTKITAAPQGETKAYTWIIANKHTRNGKLLKSIFHRLDNQ